jgi:hypothetical protein
MTQIMVVEKMKILYKMACTNSKENKIYICWNQIRRWFSSYLVINCQIK